MASTLPSASVCCEESCEEQVSVAVPGPQGEPGADGADGIDGINAFTTITGGAAVMPAEGANVTLGVVDSTWMQQGQLIFVQQRGYLEVQSKPDSTHVILKNLENTGTGAYSGNSPPGTLFTAALGVSPGGVQGPTGATGPSGSADLVSGEAFFMAHGNANIATSIDTVSFADDTVFKIALPSAGRYKVTAQMYLENKDGDQHHIYGRFWRSATATAVTNSQRKTGFPAGDVTQFIITGLVDVSVAQDLEVQVWMQEAFDVVPPIVANETETGPFENPAYLCYIKVSDP